MLQPALHMGVPSDGSALTVGDYLDQWLFHCRGRVRAKTDDGYRGLIRLYASSAFGEVPLGALRGVV